jgi:peptidyl-prolyl cis-trans isomerase B (cyclophilin B)
MKKILLTLLCLTASLHLFAADHAGDVALLTIKIEGQDQLMPVIFEFNDNDAPGTVANFKKLSHKGFYNGIAFHRVFPHILVQAGDPLSRGKNRSRVGTGGPGYTLPAEIHLKNVVGAVAMSRLPDKINPGRVSSGSQFYVCLKAQPNLDGQYTVFAHVIRGMDNLDKVSVLPADSNDNPVTRAVIKSVRILPATQAQIQAERIEKAKPSIFTKAIHSVSW